MAHHQSRDLVAAVEGSSFQQRARRCTRERAHSCTRELIDAQESSSRDGTRVLVAAQEGSSLGSIRGLVAAHSSSHKRTRRCTRVLSLHKRTRRCTRDSSLRSTRELVAAQDDRRCTRGLIAAQEGSSLNSTRGLVAAQEGSSPHKMAHRWAAQEGSSLHKRAHRWAAQEGSSLHTHRRTRGFVAAHKGSSPHLAERGLFATRQNSFVAAPFGTSHRALIGGGPVAETEGSSWPSSSTHQRSIDVELVTTARGARRERADSVHRQSVLARARAFLRQGGELGWCNSTTSSQRSSQVTLCCG